MMPLISLALTAATKRCRDWLISASSLAWELEQEEATNVAATASTVKEKLRRFIGPISFSTASMALKRDQFSLIDRQTDYGRCRPDGLLPESPHSASLESEAAF